VRLRSINLQFDKYLIGGLFASGGALLWNGDMLDATVSGKYKLHQCFGISRSWNFIC